MLDSLLLSHIPYDLTFSHDSQATRSSIYVKSIFMSPRQCLDLVTRMSQRPVEPVDKLLLRVINKSEIKIFVDLHKKYSIGESKETNDSIETKITNIHRQMDQRKN